MSTASPDRMTAILRMAVEYAREMLEREGVAWPSAAIERIDIAPVRLALDTVSDRAAAQEIGDAILSALLRRSVS
jgi:hypothetical protein